VLCLAQQQRPSVAPEMTRRNTSQSVTDAADNATISARSPAQLVVLIDNPAGFKDDLAESVTSPIEVTIRRPSRRRRARCTTKSIACPIMSAAMSLVCRARRKVHAESVERLRPTPRGRCTLCRRCPGSWRSTWRRPRSRLSLRRGSPPSGSSDRSELTDPELLLSRAAIFTSSGAEATTSAPCESNVHGVDGPLGKRTYQWSSFRYWRDSSVELRGAG
jgi:hypothetical protein